LVVVAPETSRTLRGATGITLNITKLGLSRKIDFMISTQFAWAGATGLIPMSPNIGLATKMTLQSMKKNCEKTGEASCTMADDSSVIRAW